MKRQERNARAQPAAADAIPAEDERAAQHLEPATRNALESAAADFSTEEMMRMGWVPGALVVPVKPHATKLGLLGAIIAFAVAAALSEHLRLAFLWALPTAFVVKLALDRYATRHGYLVLLPDRLTLWARMPLIGTLICEHQCRWDEVEWLRDRQCCWRASDDPTERELVLGSAKSNLSLGGSDLVSVEDWPRVKQTIIEKADLSGPTHTVERSWWTKDEYLQYRRGRPGEEERSA